jgi:hypothetical protein
VTTPLPVYIGENAAAELGHYCRAHSFDKLLRCLWIGSQPGDARAIGLHRYARAGFRPAKTARGGSLERSSGYCGDSAGPEADCRLVEHGGWRIPPVVPFDAYLRVIAHELATHTLSGCIAAGPVLGLLFTLALNGIWR